MCSCKYIHVNLFHNCSVIPLQWQSLSWHFICVSRIILYGNIKVEHKKGILLIGTLFCDFSIKSENEYKYIGRSNNMSSPNITIDSAK